ncbi:Rrf2 family transcriptional regulator, partial [Psychrobacter sp. 1Y1]|uniref:Rrf2 family transcriptional regulator n=1 Tax=Psychrobacter sp. 1Y1 TaxID=3453574 RepID=UPI003F4752C2
NHISKVVHHLGKLGYLQTVRGKSGGFKLAKPATDINIGQVVRALENSLAPIDCSKPYCLFTPACKLKGVLGDAVNAYLAVLDAYTLDMIVTNKPELKSLLPDLSISILQ